ncbi:metallophosphoesterase [Lewinella sp. W8]|uniref:metallophosphoesterase n=1 Tax=Lewinella sp. W8 TaxID=2528208 RepID=UPI0012B5C1F3|nr:metallophosphoesterase [Lewinella sp. W8]
MRYPKLSFLLFWALLSAFSLSAQEEATGPDGPYLIYGEEGLTAYWANIDEKTKESVSWAEITEAALPDFASFRPELVDPEREFKLPESVVYKGVKKIAAISDIHGQYPVARKLLETHGIIDENQNWAFGEGHLVVVGDVFDRGDQVNQTLWLLHNLQLQAEAAGGKLHFLLGNHETMILEGDDRYVHRNYRITSALMTRTYQQLYGPDTYLGKWLRSLPLAVKINDLVFVHGGLSKEVVKAIDDDLDNLNHLYHKYLIDGNIVEATGRSGKLALLYQREGPLWYRGYFMEEETTEKDLNWILKRMGASRIIVGHTSFEAIRSYFDGRVIAIDSSIKFGNMGEVLLIQDNKFYGGGLLGDKEAIFNRIAGD